MEKATEVGSGAMNTCNKEEKVGYGEWTTVQRNRRRGQSMARGSLGNAAEFQKTTDGGRDNAGSKQNSQRRSSANKSMGKMAYSLHQQRGLGVIKAP